MQKKIIDIFLSLKQKNKIPHNFLLVGQENVLQKQIDIICKIIVCPQNYQCVNCKVCQKITNKSSLLYKVSPLNGKIIVEQIQELISWAQFKTKDSKIYWIQNLEQITKQGANKLLKFLENEHQNYFGIISTSNERKLLKTLKSRLMTFEVKNDTFKMIYLQEKFKNLSQKDYYFLQFLNQKRFYIDQNFFDQTLIPLQKKIEFFNNLLKNNNFDLLYHQENFYQDDFTFFLFLEFLIIEGLNAKEKINNPIKEQKWNKIINISQKILFDNENHYQIYQRNLKTKICFLKWMEEIIFLC